MNIMNNYWKCIVMNIITCTFGYGTLIGEVHVIVWPQYGHRLCC